MGLMDKVKSQANTIAEKAQEAGQAGQAKIAELQSKRKADSLLTSLGGLVYMNHTGRAAPDGESQVAALVAQLQALEAEHGPITLGEPAETAS